MNFVTSNKLYLRYSLIEDEFLSYNVEEMNFLLQFPLLEHRRHAVSQNIKRKMTELTKFNKNVKNHSLWLVGIYLCFRTRS